MIRRPGPRRFRSRRKPLDNISKIAKSNTAQENSSKSISLEKLAPKKDSFKDMRIEKMGEDFEKDLLGGRNEAGKLVDIHKGAPENGLAVSIHGINGNPENMTPMSNGTVSKDISSKTYAYDDNYRRLTDTSKDFAKSLGSWLDKNPGKPLRIDAHSMGTRVTLAAVDQLAKAGKLEGHEVSLNLVAPPLAGFDAANGASKVTFLGGLIPNIRPGADMGSESDFQKDLESIKLPSNVKTNIFVGGKDTIVDSTTDKFAQMAKQLGAEVQRFPGAGHNEAIQSTQDWMNNQ